MATWKKLVVSGSDISHLNNDSGYIVSGDTTILSGSFSGSFQGDGSGLTGVSAQVEETLTLGAGIFGGTFDGSTAITAAIDSGSLAGNGLTTSGGKILVNANGTTIDVQSSGIQVVEANLRDIPNVALVNSGSILGTTKVDLGATVTDLAGLGTVSATAFSGSFNGSGADITGVVLGNSVTDGNGIADFTFDGSGAASVAVEADGSTLTVGADGVKVSSAGITGVELNSSVAGAGLAGGAGSALSVSVDGSTVEINSDALRVKAGGIGTTQLANDSVTTDKIAHSLGEINVHSFTGSFSGSFAGDVDIDLEDLTAGNGLSGTAYDGQVARTFAVDVDGSTLAVAAAGVKVADAGITETQLNTSVAGVGIAGGAGTALSVDLYEVGVADFDASGTSDWIVFVDDSNDTTKKTRGSSFLTSIAGNGLEEDGGQIEVKPEGSTIEVGMNGVKVADAGITVTQLADNAVTTLKILDANVTNAKLANDSVTIGTTEVDLGTAATTLVGLASVTSTAFTGSLLGNASTSTKIASITNSNIVQLAATQALTNKDLTGAGNTFPTFNQSTTGTAATASLALSVSPNSVALGTDTTGDYVASLGSPTGLTIGSNSGEGSQPTIAVNYGASANQAAEGNSTVTFTGTTNEVTVSNAAAQAIGGGVAVTIGLPDDVTITQDLTVSRDLLVTRNLTVQGTASFNSEQNLVVADRFILMASGSQAAGDGGIVIQQTTNGTGELFGFENATGRWAVDSAFAADGGEAFSPDAFMAAVVEGGVGVDTPSAVGAQYVKKGNLFVGANEDIYIYS